MFIVHGFSKQPVATFVVQWSKCDKIFLKQQLAQAKLARVSARLMLQMLLFLMVF